jgi:glycosyltransferase A (GT-A) superfamily protein (DUF2064 family)
MEIDKEHTTAILVFANSSHHELQRKPMVNGVVLFEALNRQTLNIVRETGLPYFHFTEKQQCGNSFGERFVNALQSVFDKGYENVITIGNDTPHLKSTDLLQTQNLLESQKFVLGPSADGGFYLMGIPRSHFKAVELLRLPWRGSGLCRALLKLASVQEKEVVRLKTLFDLDTIGDLRLLVHRFQNVGKYLLSLIFLLIRQKRERLPSLRFSPALGYRSNFFNKGSPILP